ncbi:hypothetical protein O181_033302 [Austropuccinia psidii MF-1]|uniref:Uncharacterized protein n=1 Tax=Austropuccinia psidii MF-1 TaxID=1389203 RepID=A0A9Q3H720_9BASI|nr:hypothetical protein [Austropuccinia psidii MF-1]
MAEETGHGGRVRLSKSKEISKRLKAIDPQMNISMSNHKLVTQIPGDVEHAVKFRCNKSCTLDDIETLYKIQNQRKNGRSYQEEKYPNNCGSADHYANNFPNAKNKVYVIEQVTEEESPPEDSESDSMVDAIREKSDYDQDPTEEFLVEYQEETQMEIEEIQLEEGMPQDTANKNLFEHTQDAQTFLLKPTKGMGYIYGKATKMTVCSDNLQHPFINYSGAHCSIVARTYLDDHFANRETQILPTKAKSLKSASGKTTSIGTIIKYIIIPHRKGNIRLNPEVFVLEDAHIQGFLLGTDYQRMYGIDIYHSKNRNINIGTNKEKEFSLDIYQIFTHDSLEELLNEFREGQGSTTLTSKQKLSFLQMLRKSRMELAIGEGPLGKIRGNDIELYLDVERPYLPMLRRTTYPVGLETRKEIEKHINELLDMDVIRRIGHNEIVEIATPVLITWHDGKSRFCVDLRALNNYTEADRYPIPRIPHPREAGKSQIYHQNGLYERVPLEWS